MLSFTEENYLKALLQLTIEKVSKAEVGTNELAAHLGVKPATATDMVKKLKSKKLINYEKYGKISLTNDGRKNAIEVLRKHRLWETFLYKKLDFTWDEIHEVAEQLEHIQSAKLVEKLDKFLGYPEFDPHGDAIPNSKGELKVMVKKTLSEVEVGNSCKMIAVKDNSAPFLQYVVKVGLGINSKIKVVSKQSYDSLIEIEVNGKKSSVSQKFAENIFIVTK
ncbi:MAG: metal-dependent transcriptional regulator [Bacteroidota bacterium]|nr:metal-dependent transcriptional regulator [Bacteroidota bacterium]MDP3144610.1 metal-dependent transcriptional regulator [Bacteroidota bacterium]